MGLFVVKQRIQGRIAFGPDFIYPAIHIDLQVGVADEMQRKLGPEFDLTINAFRGGEGNGVLLRKDPVVWAVSRKAAPYLKHPVPPALLPQGSLLRRWAEETLTAAGKRWVVLQESSPSSEMWLERADRELPRAAKCLYEFLLEQLPRWGSSRASPPPPRTNRCCRHDSTTAASSAVPVRPARRTRVTLAF